MGLSPAKVYPAFSVIYADNTSIAGSYLSVYGSNDTLLVDNSSVWGNGEKLTGNYNHLWGTSSTITGNGNVVTGNANTVHGDHNELHGNYLQVSGISNEVFGDISHVDGDYSRVTGNYNQVSGTDLIVFGVGNHVTLQNANGMDPAKLQNYVYGYWNDISDRDNETVKIRGDNNTLHVAHSDTIWLGGPPQGSVQANSDTLDFSQAVSGKSDVYGFNATDTIVVGYGETTTITMLADGSTNLHIAGGGGASYDVVFHDGGADVAAHIVHAFFVA